MNDQDPITQKALFRFQVLSAYLAADPPRGKRRQMLEKLADKTWMLQSGEILTVKAETIRYWLRVYRLGGFEALKDKPRSDKGIRAIPAQLIEQACKLKLQVPERSIERIITIMESLQLAPPGLVRRSTLHRALKQRGLSKRKLSIPDRKDLDRWQADYANDLWQADMLKGPWLPDPKRPGKMRRSYLYAFLDDASRLLLYGRFFFKGDLPALELVLKRALQRYGKPARVYYDNAMVFKAKHMQILCAELGIHRPIYTTPYRPEGHGKIEAFNRFCINNFIAEVKASNIITLDRLNEAFFAWIDEEYNHRKHSELGISPKKRWLRDSSRIEYLDEEKIRIAFLWRELRTPDKTAVIRLFNRAYKLSPTLAKRRVEIRYDPEHLHQIEIYLDGSFRQRAKTLQITPHRAPKEILPVPQDLCAEEKIDYLAWLTQKHKGKIRLTSPGEKSDSKQNLQGFLSILRDRLDPEVFDQIEATAFFETYGPFDLQRLENILTDLLAAHPPNLHLSFYFNHIQNQLFGGQS
ncbi:MAG: DDE-type integrase/transposase/recombinase [Syntrophaceae bacterium]|nr:DDE-type integrase/transposase/recombinase [Syntrophaceae bacterium]